VYVEVVPIRVHHQLLDVRGEVGALVGRDRGAGAEDDPCEALIRNRSVGDRDRRCGRQAGIDAHASSDAGGAFMDMRERPRRPRRETVQVHHEVECRTRDVVRAIALHAHGDHDVSTRGGFGVGDRRNFVRRAQLRGEHDDVGIAWFGRRVVVATRQRQAHQEYKSYPFQHVPSPYQNFLVMLNPRYSAPGVPPSAI
jgi:hypothetical protein